LEFITKANLASSERELIIHLLMLPDFINKAAQNESPAVVANYCFDLAQKFNSLYQDLSILRESDDVLKNNRLLIAAYTADTLKFAMALLGIKMPERM
jgi:arginyl-tRNA synthetase